MGIDIRGSHHEEEIEAVKKTREWLADKTDKGHNKAMVANDRQVGGSHYKTDAGIPQHWDLVTMYGWGYLQAQVIKYLMRWEKKNGVEDLEKARHYLDKYIEVEQAKRAANINSGFHNTGTEGTSSNRTDGG